MEVARILTTRDEAQIGRAYRTMDKLAGVTDRQGLSWRGMQIQTSPRRQRLVALVHSQGIAAWSTTEFGIRE